jgi:general secretion pathway protein M
MIGEFVKKIQIRSGFNRLEQREKGIIFLGIFILVCFVVLQFGVGPYLDSSRKLDRALANRHSDIAELKLLQQDYRELQAEAGGIKEKINTRDPGFSLFSFLDGQASAAEVKDYISYMKPSTAETRESELLKSVVELKLQEISLSKLVTFLEGIESSENVISIQRMSIQENSQNEGLLDVILQIVTFVEKS